jgi:hypothetical protein
MIFIRSRLCSPAAFGGGGGGMGFVGRKGTNLTKEKEGEKDVGTV